jgi:hypothetical protein
VTLAELTAIYLTTHPLYLFSILCLYFADKTQTEDRFDRVMEELRRDPEEQSRKWDEQKQKGDEQNKRWEANQQVTNEMLADNRKLSQKHDSTIGALGIFK